MTAYLASFKTDDPTMYDELKCLKSLNEFTNYQNNQLQKAIKELQQEHPHAKIIYADYFTALKDTLRFAASLGQFPADIFQLKFFIKSIHFVISCNLRVSFSQSQESL